jgi:RHS repeat-associated protein
VGYWNDHDSPLNYARSRWFDPTLGRWMSRDPVESEHPYAYAGNSPTLGSDPSGRQAVDDSTAPWIRANIQYLTQFGIAPGQPGANRGIFEQLRALAGRGVTLGDIYGSGGRSRDRQLVYLWAALRYNAAIGHGVTSLSAARDREAFLLRHGQGMGEWEGLAAQVSAARATGGQYPIAAYNHLRWAWEGTEPALRPPFEDPGQSWTKAAIAHALLDPYRGDFIASARRNGIPAWLLQTVVLAEILDTQFKDQVEDLWPDRVASALKREPSIGMAQLQADRALAHHLVDVSTDEVRSRLTRRAFGPRYHSAREAMLAIARERLLDPRHAIEAPAREIAFEIRALKNAPANSAFRRYAVHYTPGSRLPHSGKWMASRDVADVPFFGRMDLTTRGVSGWGETVAEENGREYLALIVHATYNSPEIVSAPRVDADAWRLAVEMGRWSAQVYGDLTDAGFFGR